MENKLGTRPDAFSEPMAGAANAETPPHRNGTYGLRNASAIGVVAAIVLSFAAVQVVPRLALGAVRPAAGCPATPPSHSPGAFLYIVSPPTSASKKPPLPVERPVPPAQLHVCGIGFHVHSTISFFISQWAGVPFIPFGPTVTSDANGSFSALLLARPAYCSTAKVGAQLRARDALGATADVALPATNPPTGFPPRAPLGPSGPGGPSEPALPCRVIE